ncbi:MAG: 50S ribosomal protein L13 [Chloroflexota bacterium]
MKTYTVKPGDIKRQWYLVDADGQTLGRLASQIASILKGKHKPIYSPYVDVGDFVVVINAGKVHVTGRKMLQKMYHHHSGYPGGLTSVSLRDLLKRHPARVIELAVRGMLPKNRLGRRMITKLKVYAGNEHPHEAQKPQALEL